VDDREHSEATMLRTAATRATETKAASARREAVMMEMMGSGGGQVEVHCTKVRVAADGMRRWRWRAREQRGRGESAGPQIQQVAWVRGVQSESRPF
jgi:hypothetical protein